MKKNVSLSEEVTINALKNILIQRVCYFENFPMTLCVFVDKSSHFTYIQSHFMLHKLEEL